jgi:hypothetical protein
MRLEDSGWSSPDFWRGYQAESARRFQLRDGFTAAWASNLVAVSVAAFGAFRQWVLFAVLVVLAVGFSSMLFAFDFTWSRADEEIPITAIKPVNETELDLAMLDAEDKAIPTEERRAWWYRLALVLWLIWAIVATIIVIAMGPDEGWAGLTIDVITVIVAWAGLLMALVGFVPLEQP